MEGLGGPGSPVVGAPGCPVAAVAAVGPGSPSFIPVFVMVLVVPLRSISRLVYIEAAETDSKGSIIRKRKGTSSIFFCMRFLPMSNDCRMFRPSLLMPSRSSKSPKSSRQWLYELVRLKAFFLLKSNFSQMVREMRLFSSLSCFSASSSIARYLAASA